MAYYQTPDRVCIEFLKSSGKGGRVIKLAGIQPGQVPQQLYGQIDQPFWDSFVSDVGILASHHPYTVAPSAGDLGRWAACGIIGSVVGVFCVNPDSGDYGMWGQEAQALVQRWQKSFQERGLSLSFQHNRTFWMQIDVVRRETAGIGYPVK